MKETFNRENRKPDDDKQAKYKYCPAPVHFLGLPLKNSASCSEIGRLRSYAGDRAEPTKTLFALRSGGCLGRSLLLQVLIPGTSHER